MKDEESELNINRHTSKGFATNLPTHRFIFGKKIYYLGNTRLALFQAFWHGLTFFSFQLACLKLKKANSPLFEDFIKAIITTLISARSRKDSESATAIWTPQQSLPLKTCSEVLVQLLKEFERMDPSRGNLSSGLLVDWYEILDPEVVQVHPLLQRQLLFQDRVSMPSWDRSLTSHEERSPSTYLLGSLTHQACWETLQDCLDWLLGHDREENR